MERVFCFEKFKLRGDDVYLGADLGLAGKAYFADIAEGDNAVLKGKKSVVFAEAYMGTWEYCGAALADDDLACAYLFTAKELHTQVFWL